MTNIYESVRDYSLALFGALVASGLDAHQAGDCANNAAAPIAAMPEYTVAEVILSSLLTQRAVGFVVSDEQIARAADACSRVPRFCVPVDDADVRVRETLPTLPEPTWVGPMRDVLARTLDGPETDTRYALPDRGEVDEPSIADELDAEFGGIFDEPAPARVDSDRSPRSAEVGRAPLAEPSGACGRCGGDGIEPGASEQMPDGEWRHERCAACDGSATAPCHPSATWSPLHPLAQRFAELPTEQRQGVEGFVRMGGAK